MRYSTTGIAGLPGAFNSNRFVYEVINAAGGEIPFSLRYRFLFGAPGLCSGMRLFTGRSCRY